MTNTDEKRERDEEKLRAAVRAELDREEPTPLARLAAAYEANAERRDQGRREDEGDR